MDIDVSSHAPETKAGIAAWRTPSPMTTSCGCSRSSRPPTTSGSPQIERRSADVVTEDKVERINAALTRRLDDADAEVGAARRSAATARRREAPTRIEHKAAFDGYMRSGESAGLRALEVKAMSVGSNPDGGYMVPVEIEHAIGARLTAISPIRAHRRPAHDLRQRLQEAVHDRRPRGRLGRRDRRAAADQLAGARLAVVPGDGALRHAGRDRDAAGGLRRQHRRVARRRGRAGLRRAGGHGLRHRRRHQQAEGLPRLHHGRQRVVELGQDRLHRAPARPAPSRRAIRPTCWST